jgi:hypothetical protein
VARAVTIAAVLSGCGTSSSTLPAQNAAYGFIDAVRANDAQTVCSMTTPEARHDLARLLRQKGAPSGADVCAQPTIASPAVLSAVMRPFLGATGASGGGSSESGSESIE